MSKNEFQLIDFDHAVTIGNSSIMFNYGQRYAGRDFRFRNCFYGNCVNWEVSDDYEMVAAMIVKAVSDGDYIRPLLCLLSREFLID